MPRSLSLPRALARMGALLTGVAAAGLFAVPAARAEEAATVTLTLAPGQSGPVGSLVSNTDITPVPTCDPGLSITFDASMAGTVTVAPDTPVGAYVCTIDFQLSGQSTGLVEDVLVNVVPGLSIDDVSAEEGDIILRVTHPNGAIMVDVTSEPETFTLTLSEPSPTAVTVGVTTADGTATADDYAGIDTTVTFPPGETTETVTVWPAADSATEPDETFTANLSAPSGAVILTGQGVGTILNDD